MPAPVKKRRSHQERRDESDARIIAAAIELYAAQGYQKTTLIQIGQAAGYTGTLISNRFGSKEGLLRAVLAHILNRFDAERRIGKSDGKAEGDGIEGDGADSRRTPADEMLRGFIAAYLQDVADKQSRIRALHVIMGEALGALPQIRNQVIKVNRIFRNRVEDYVRHGIDSGLFRATIDPTESAVVIVGLLRGVTNQYLTEPHVIDVAALVPAIQASVIAALTADN